MDTATTTSGGGGGGWESLHEDILHLIIHKFSKFQDAIRMSFVCKSWRSKSHSAILHRLLKKKLPLLIVPSDSDHRSSSKGSHGGFGCCVGGGGGGGKCGGSSVCHDTIGLISPLDGDGDDGDDGDDVDDALGLISLFDEKEKKNVVYKMHLPEIADRRICGSSEGWLITVHENAKVQLLNPISRVLVHLPSLFNAGFVCKFEKNKPWRYFWTISRFVRVILSSLRRGHGGIYYYVDHVEPLYDSQYFRDFFFEKVVTNNAAITTTTSLPTVVMAIYGDYGRLAFCRPYSSSLLTGNGNDDEPTRWISLLQKCDTYYCVALYYEDVTFYKGNFYAVDSYGDVFVAKDLDGSSPFVETIIQKPGDWCLLSRKYLVESSPSSYSGGGGGDLLLVMRSLEKSETPTPKERPYRTIGFKVLKLDFNEPRSWVEVTNLGEDCALFVGYNHSFSLSATKFPGCRGNCIYFTDDKRQGWGNDMGVFNLEDASIESDTFYETSSSQFIMPPPIWYLPHPTSSSLPALSNCVEKQQGLFEVLSETPTPVNSTSYILPSCSAETTTTTRNTSLFAAVNKKNKLHLWLKKMKKPQWLFKVFTKDGAGARHRNIEKLAPSYSCHHPSGMSNPN